MTDLEMQRLVVQHLLDEDSPRDAMASYYALHHDPNRTELFLHCGEDMRPDGFLVRAQTGADLFRPLVTLHAAPESAGTLLKAGLIPGRPYYVVLPYLMCETVLPGLEISDPQVLRVYRLDPACYQPVINVLVQSHRGFDGLPRREIRSQGRIYAMAGINWRSPQFAEVYVSVDAMARGRGWGRSVVSALVGELWASGVTPLYVVSEDNEASLSVADAVGFVDTGVRRFAGCAFWS